MTNRGIQVFRKAVVVRIFHAHVFDFTYKKKCNCTQAVDPNQTTVNINNENNAVNELCVFRMMSSRIEREREDWNQALIKFRLKKIMIISMISYSNDGKMMRNAHTLPVSKCSTGHTQTRKIN